MRKLNTRQLHKRMFKELDVIPFIITKNEKPYAIVLPYDPAYKLPYEESVVSSPSTFVEKTVGQQESSQATQEALRANTYENHIEKVGEKLTVFGRLKRILSHKVL